MKVFKHILPFISKNIPIVLLGLFVGVFIWLLRDRSKLKKDNLRLFHNIKELIQEKEQLLSDFNVTSKEMAHFINWKMPELEKKLDSANLKIKNIQRVVVHKTIYRDTITKTTDLKPVLTAIRKIHNKSFARPVVVPVVDLSPCLIIRGLVSYDGENLSLSVTDREFKSLNEVVTHIERKPWNLLGISTRIFGRKRLKVTVFNNCGETQTTILTKKGRKWLKR
ncbi:MAG: hypothetical protein AAF634_13160 [Bacteroidota bacterium]